MSAIADKNKIRFSCPHCGGQLDVPVYLAGVEGPCPLCSGTIRAPESQAAADEIARLAALSAPPVESDPPGSPAATSPQEAQPSDPPEAAERAAQPARADENPRAGRQIRSAPRLAREKLRGQRRPEPAAQPESKPKPPADKKRDAPRQSKRSAPRFAAAVAAQEKPTRVGSNRKSMVIAAVAGFVVSAVLIMILKSVFGRGDSPAPTDNPGQSAAQTDGQPAVPAAVGAATKQTDPPQRQPPPKAQVDPPPKTQVDPPPRAQVDPEPQPAPPQPVPAPVSAGDPPASAAASVGVVPGARTDLKSISQAGKEVIANFLRAEDAGERLAATYNGTDEATAKEVAQYFADNGEAATFDSVSVYPEFVGMAKGGTVPLHLYRAQLVGSPVTIPIAVWDLGGALGVDWRAFSEYTEQKLGVVLTDPSQGARTLFGFVRTPPLEKEEPSAAPQDENAPPPPLTYAYVATDPWGTEASVEIPATAPPDLLATLEHGKLYFVRLRVSWEKLPAKSRLKIESFSNTPLELVR